MLTHHSSKSGSSSNNSTHSTMHSRGMVPPGWRRGRRGLRPPRNPASRLPHRLPLLDRIVLGTCEYLPSVHCCTSASCYCYDLCLPALRPRCTESWWRCRSVWIMCLQCILLSPQIHQCTFSRLPECFYLDPLRLLPRAVWQRSIVGVGVDLILMRIAVHVTVTSKNNSSSQLMYCVRVAQRDACSHCVALCATWEQRQLRMLKVDYRWERQVRRKSYKSIETSVNNICSATEEMM